MTDNSTISNGSDYSDEGEEGEEENEEGLGEVDENGNPVVTTKITTYDAREGTDIILAQEANDILESSELINSLAGKYTMRGRRVQSHVMEKSTCSFDFLFFTLSRPTILISSIVLCNPPSYKTIINIYLETSFFFFNTFSILHSSIFYTFFFVIS